MSVCLPASVRELMQGAIECLLTCSCKSIIDSQCEYTVLWTMIEYSWIKRSQSLSSDSGTVTFFFFFLGTRHPSPQANSETLSITAPCVFRDSMTHLSFRWLFSSSECNFVWFIRVQKVCIITVTVRVRKHWMSAVWEHEAESFILDLWDGLDVQLGLRKKSNRP